MQLLNSRTSHRIQSLVEQDLYSTWLGEELNNMTACIRAPTSITVNEPYNMRGMWVSVNEMIKPTLVNEYSILLVDQVIYPFYMDPCMKKQRIYCEH